MSKYQYKLKPYIIKTLTNLLASAEFSDEDDAFLISVHNLNLVNELNEELAEIDTNLPIVRKKQGSVSTYVIFPSSYKRLYKRFNLEPKPSSGDE